MKFRILLSVLFAFLLVNVPASFSADLTLSTDSEVYSKDQILFVFGKGDPNGSLILRLSAPDDTIAKFDQIAINSEGFFHHPLLVWPEESTDFPFGTYSVEAITEEGFSQKLNLKFTLTSELVEVPVERQLNTLVFAPETSAVGNSVRIFVQTTSDGLLVGSDPIELLGNSHVHLPSGVSVPLSNSFQTLHQGLYFVDYTPIEEGTHVFHVVAFSQGTASHGSSATTVLSQDLGGISEQILTLNSVLSETSKQLDTLKSEIEGFDTTLEHASTKIDESTSTIDTSVQYIGESSSQLNSLLLPIIGATGFIVALQIAILARRR